MKSITEVVQNLLKPYIDKNIETATGELGAKNLCPNDATSQLSHGIQYQVDSTGKITASGATDGANSWFTIADFSLAKGKYILSGCPSGGSVSGYALCVNFNGASAQYFDFGDGYEFELSETTTLLVRIRIADPTTLTTNKDFYPMIRPASIADDTYVSYAKTNRELTANVTPQTTDIRTSLNTLLQAADSDFSTQSVWLTTYGELKVLSGRISVASAKDYHYTIDVSSIIPKPKNITNFPCMGTDLIAGGCMMLNTNGELIIRIKSTGNSYFDLNGVYV